MELSCLFPNKIDWNVFFDYIPDTIFSDDVVEYLNALSASLLSDRNCRNYPDVVTFAFFCRKGNIIKIKESENSDGIRIGRGVLFHIAPSNVPVNFAYSLIAGLLSGNSNVVRVSSKEFPQVDIIINHIVRLATDEKYSKVSSRIALVRYHHESEANLFFSSVANVRLIWGGDNTILKLRECSTPSRSFDVCFADRYSIAMLKPSSILDCSDKEISALAENFYNDTYLFDQNACSAPHLLLWANEKGIEDAKEKFWDAVYDYAVKMYELQSVIAIDKLTAFFRQSVCHKINKIDTRDNLIVRSHLKELPSDIDSFRCAGGYFSEYDFNDMLEIKNIVTEKYQTLAYYGYSAQEMRDFVFSARMKGIDRIVPIGKTTSFSFKWDGYNLIKTLSRLVDVY